MLINNTFAFIEDKIIKAAKFITKKQVFLFHDIGIQLILNRKIMLSQKTRIRDISLIKDYEALTTSLGEVIHTNFLPKE